MHDSPKLHCYESLTLSDCNAIWLLKPSLLNPCSWLRCGVLLLHVSHELSCWWNVWLVELKYCLAELHRCVCVCVCATSISSKLSEVPNSEFDWVWSFGTQQCSRNVHNNNTSQHNTVSINWNNSPAVDTAVWFRELSIQLWIFLVCAIVLLDCFCMYIMSMLLCLLPV